VSSPSERLYEIALQALAQQRQALDSARSAIPAAGAAAAVIGGALAKAAFAAPGTANTVCALVGAVGAAAVLIFGVLTLASPAKDVVVSFPARDIERRAQPLMDDSNAFHLALASFMDTRREANEDGVREIRRWLLITLGGLVVEAAGFVLAVVVHF